MQRRIERFVVYVSTGQACFAPRRDNQILTKVVSARYEVDLHNEFYGVINTKLKNSIKLKDYKRKQTKKYK